MKNWADEHADKMALIRENGRLGHALYLATCAGAAFREAYRDRSTAINVPICDDMLDRAIRAYVGTWRDQ